MTRWRAALLGALISSLVLHGCVGHSDQMWSFQILNRTGQTIRVFYVDEQGERQVVHSLGDGGSTLITDVLSRLDPPTCTKGILIVRDLLGVEITRRTEPICVYETWRIEPPRSPPPT